jgi:transcriptional regulator with XRE-family HTH domain
VTEYGKQIKKRLIDLDKKQVWLIEEVQKKTGLYFDDSYLSKILNGKIATPGMLEAINETLWPQKNKGGEQDAERESGV